MENLRSKTICIWIFSAAISIHSTAQSPTTFSQSKVAGNATLLLGETISGVSLDRLNRMDEFLRQEQEANRIPASVFMLKRKGQLIRHQAYGVKSPDDPIPISPDEIFYIQSMTKPIVSVAFMMLYEQGLFSLSDPVSKYLPEFRALKVANSQDETDMEFVDAEAPITIEQVLTHTAGFSHGLGQTDLEKRYFKELYMTPHENIEDRVGALAKLPLVGQPGAAWYYSASPDILALLIEKFSGVNCSDFLREELFEPLGMKDTGYNLRTDNADRKAYLYATGPDGTMQKNPDQTPATGHQIFGGTHGLYSTAADYMRFCEMLLNDGLYEGKTFLSRKTIELMTSNFLEESQGRGDGQGFGLGFGIVEDPAEDAKVGSMGTYYWGGAFNTYFFIDPTEEMIAILMMQFWPYTEYYAEKLRQLTYQAIVD